MVDKPSEKLGGAVTDKTNGEKKVYVKQAFCWHFIFTLLDVITDNFTMPDETVKKNVRRFIALR